MFGSDVLAFLWVPLIVVMAIIMIRRNAGFSQTLGMLILATYICAVVSVTFFPIPVQSNYIAILRKDQRDHNNFIPLKTIRDVMASPLDDIRYNQLGGNFMLLMPLTALLPFFWRRFRSLASAFKVGLAVSLGIELTQLLVSLAYGFTWKIFDVDDLIINTLGALFGYALYFFLAKVTSIISLRRGKVSTANGEENP